MEIILEELGWHCGICGKEIKTGEEYICVAIQTERINVKRGEITVDVTDSVPIAFVHIDCAKDIDKLKLIVNKELEDSYMCLSEDSGDKNETG